MSAIYDELDAWSSGDTDLYPCRQSPIHALRQAAVLGDVARARRIVSRMDGSLDASLLVDVMHLLVTQRLVPDLLRAGLRAAGLSSTMQGGTAPHIPALVLTLQHRPVARRGGVRQPAR